MEYEFKRERQLKRTSLVELSISWYVGTMEKGSFGTPIHYTTCHPLLTNIPLNEACFLLYITTVVCRLGLGSFLYAHVMVMEILVQN